MSPPLRARAEYLADEWLKNDFDPATRATVCQWLQDSNYAEIENRLSGANRLVFGTAGLRGRMGPGFDRMNCLTVLQTTQGVCKYIRARCVGDKSILHAVVGFDGRHNSEAFAHVAAAVFVANKFKVHFIEKPSPTPFTPFLIPRIGAACGVQITASHNPKADNGYKLYWHNGAQIVPPVDSGIASAIAESLEVQLDVFRGFDSSTLRLGEGKVENVFTDVFNTYTSVISGDLSLHAKIPKKSSTLTFCYTAMHGVGYVPLMRLFEAFGFDPVKSVVPVAAQVEIDPEFPTVAFPNPEERGALSLAIETASKFGCDYVLANDPDADRFTAAERQPDGTWHQFSGDELGLLFVDYRLDTMKEGNLGLVVSSVVSSRMASALCAARTRTDRPIIYRDCLTGFKWIANESIAALAADPSLTHLLGYEEAIGYQLSPLVADKDGLSAACVFAEMATVRGGNLKARLEKIQREEIGFFATNNGYYLVADPKVTAVLFANFRASGMQALGEFRISSIRDVTNGVNTGAGEHSNLPKTPDAEMIQIFFENGAVVTLRASGTEPKLKFYSELASKVSAEDAKAQLDKLVSAIKTHFYQPHIYPMKEQPVM